MSDMRAKFTLAKVGRHIGMEVLTFEAQYSENKEDNSYSKATPSANLQMTVTNEALFGKFAPGDKFYVDFTKAE